MKNSILLMLAVFLIASFCVPAYAQTISDHVVINELDINPNGDDSKSISEWVELYNPTNFEVDLSGWEIASTTILKKTLTIPDNTVISPDDTLIFTYQKNWFTDSNESVELRNSNGIIIDKTPTITDLQNNFLSWQRVLDGSSDWKFLLASAGASNGKSTSESNLSKVIIDVSTDKSSYLFDETAIIQGTVSKKVFIEKPTFQVAPIKINISGPNFYQSISMYPDNYLNYETTLDLVQVLGINDGTYDVSVSYDGVTSTTSFVVGYATIEEFEELESNFNIVADKPTYLPGEFISVSGFISQLIPYESIKFTINDSNGKLIGNGNLFTSDGNFQTSIFLSTVNPDYGTYTVTGQYGDEITLSTFNVVESIQEESVTLVSDSLIFNIDKTQYFTNQKMRLSGMVTNFDSSNNIYYQIVKFNFKASDGTAPTMSSAIKDKSVGSQEIEFTLTAIPDDTGAFSIDVRIPAVSFFEGDYTVKANYGGLIEYQTFSILPGAAPIDGTSSLPGNPMTTIPGKPSSVNEKFDSIQGRFIPNLKTVIEKVNRISDSLISIETQEKTINEQSVKPRVLSGSMMTVSKDSSSNVNLLVSSESGICIIGDYSDCLVSESTRKPGQIFEVVQVDGMNLNVRYSGPDVRLEKFSILPQSSDDFLPDTNWNVQIIKDNEVSRFYYKVTYKTTE
jgi:hypothetical protein